jgi:hypothetical protein
MIASLRRTALLWVTGLLTVVGLVTVLIAHVYVRGRALPTEWRRRAAIYDQIPTSAGQAA